MVAEITGERGYADRAYRSFHWASFVADEHGWARVGVDRPDYYNPYHIYYRTFDQRADEILCLTFGRKSVRSVGNKIPRISDVAQKDAWIFDREHQLPHVDRPFPEVEISVYI